MHTASLPWTIPAQVHPCHAVASVNPLFTRNALSALSMSRRSMLEEDASPNSGRPSGCHAGSAANGDGPRPWLHGPPRGGAREPFAGVSGDVAKGGRLSPCRGEQGPCHAHNILGKVPLRRSFVVLISPRGEEAGKSIGCRLIDVNAVHAFNTNSTTTRTMDTLLSFCSDRPDLVDVLDRPFCHLHQHSITCPSKASEMTVPSVQPTE